MDRLITQEKPALPVMSGEVSDEKKRISRERPITIYFTDYRAGEVKLPCFLKPTDKLDFPCPWLYAENNKYENFSLSHSKVGKWMLFFSKEQIDDQWEKIKKGVREGELWSAKVSTYPNGQQAADYVIIVYTENYTFLSDVVRVLYYLQDEILESRNQEIYYKTDEQTLHRIYSYNTPKSFMYCSSEVVRRQITYPQVPDYFPRVTIELIPTTGHDYKINIAVTENSWFALLQDLKDKHNRCDICDNDREEKLKPLEKWDYDEKNHVQRLKGMTLLCQLCYKLKCATASQLKNRNSAVTNWLRSLNKWPINKTFNYVMTCVNLWRMKSRQKWSLDINWLMQQKNCEIKRGKKHKREETVENGVPLKKKRKKVVINSPLFNAVVQGNEEEIKRLLPGAKTKTAICEKNTKAQHILFVAVQNKNLPVMTLLLKNSYVQSWLLEKGVYGIKPLHQAAKTNFEKGVKKLLEYKVDITSTNRFERTSLHLAAIEKDLSMCRLLIKLDQTC